MAALASTSSTYSLAQFIHDRVMKQTPYKVMATEGNKTEAVTVVPDAYMLFVKHKESGKEEQIPVPFAGKTPFLVISW